MNQSLGPIISQVIPQVLASGLCISLITIQEPSGTLTGSGSPNRVYVDVAGLVDLTCMAAPLTTGSIVANEVKTMTQILAQNNGHCFMPSYHPEIINGYMNGWRAIVDGVAYDILGAENDSQRTQTRLKLELSSI